MGIHTGEPIVTEEGYVGLDVHRAARIAGVAHGGQVLVSQSTRELAAADGLHDLGEHRLKDLTAPERIWQLGDGEFPPLRSLNATNLPVAAGALVGRDHEVRALVELLTRPARLVTVTGTGGTGKNRLALQVAGELVGELGGGVFFVPLAGVPSADLVAGAIASAVGVRALSELRGRRDLLVLDNFEHVLDAAPALSELLAGGTDLKLLVTSRAPLRIEGEREYTLEPLPDDEAVDLLTQRARAVRPDFVPDEAAREICRRLDGLPLAIELAASRLRSLGSDALLERLERRLPVLTTGRRDVPERQRTLRATLEWSYDLLDSELQRVFARLGVFSTFSLDAAESVAEADLDTVDMLVEASLVKHLDADRYLMLETIRELALERLEESGEADEIRRRLVANLTALAESANLTIEGEGPMRHELVVPERDNIRAALEWALDSEEVTLGLRLASALENLWMTTDPAEGAHWVEALLARGEVDRRLHALALRCLGNSAAITDDRPRALELYTESLDEFRKTGDELHVAVGLHRLGATLAAAGRPEEGAELVDEALHYFQHSGFAKGEAQCYSFFAFRAQVAGKPDDALAYLDRCVELCRKTGFTWWEIHTLGDQAVILFGLGRLEEAGRCARESLEVATDRRPGRDLLSGYAPCPRCGRDRGPAARRPSPRRTGGRGRAGTGRDLEGRSPRPRRADPRPRRRWLRGRACSGAQGRASGCGAARAEGAGRLGLRRRPAAGCAKGANALRPGKAGCGDKQERADGGEDEQRNREGVRVARAEAVDRPPVGGAVGACVGAGRARAGAPAAGAAVASGAAAVVVVPVRGARVLDRLWGPGAALGDLGLHRGVDVVGGARVVAQVLRQVPDRVAVAVERIGADGAAVRPVVQHLLPARRRGGCLPWKQERHEHARCEGCEDWDERYGWALRQ